MLSWQKLRNPNPNLNLDLLAFQTGKKLWHTGYFCAGKRLCKFYFLPPCVRYGADRRRDRRHRLIVPRCRLNTYGRRAFPVSGPTVWNSLPDELRDPACDVDEAAFTSVTSALEVNFNVMRSINLRFTYLLYGLTVQGYDNSESSVRKAAVFCLVAVYLVVGEELRPHLAPLSTSKVHHIPYARWLGGVTVRTTLELRLRGREFDCRSIT